MKKSFRFDAATEEERAQEPRKLELELEIGEDKVEVFDLVTDLTGLEVLEAVAATSGGAGTARGALRFLQRVIRDEDWIRFGESTRGATAQQLGSLVGEVIDLYVNFPTTVGTISTSGPASTGSTSEPSSESQESISPEPALTS